MRIDGTTPRICSVAAIAAGLLLGCESQRPNRRSVAPRPAPPRHPEPAPASRDEPPRRAAPDETDAPDTAPLGERARAAEQTDTAGRDDVDAPDVVVAPPEPTAPADVPPEEPAPTWPNYLHVLERFDPARPARIALVEAEDYRLALNTSNVQRLRIDRRAAPLTRRRSIVLRLDTQPFEWVVDSPVTVFERSEQGVWRPVPPDEAGARRGRGDGG